MIDHSRPLARELMDKGMTRDEKLHATYMILIWARDGYVDKKFALRVACEGLAEIIRGGA